MKVKIFILIFLFLAIISCNVLSPKKKGNVIMIEGPIFEDGLTIFYFKGRVQNIGDGMAYWVRIHIYVRNSAGNLLAQEYAYADDDELNPGDTSAWEVLFSDGDHSLRDIMDISKITYEIEWDNEE